MCLDISSIPKLVQTLVITYDEIFQALAVEGDILLVKPFLDHRLDSVIRLKLLTLEKLFYFAKYTNVQRG
jgi:hypothetical protein